MPSGAVRPEMKATVFGEVWPDHQEIVGSNLGDEMARLYLSYLSAEPRQVHFADMPSISQTLDSPAAKVQPNAECV